MVWVHLTINLVQEMRIYIKLFITYFNCIILVSCGFQHIDIPLGEGYYFVPDGQYSAIVKSTKEKYDGISMEVIPGNVIDYEFDQTTIIAKSLEMATGKKEFWIINKGIPVHISECKGRSPKFCDEVVLRANVKGPLDSISFLRLIEQNNIRLHFED